MFNRADGSSEAAHLAALVASAWPLSMTVGSIILPQNDPSVSSGFLLVLLVLRVTLRCGSMIRFQFSLD